MLGYVAFGADIYGKDKRPASVEDAAKFSSAWKADRKKLRTRINAALKVLQKQTFVDKNRLGATGYCFGGTTVLELARSGANVKAVLHFMVGWILKLLKMPKILKLIYWFFMAQTIRM
jgi:dienelactone hydrolase